MDRENIETKELVGFHSLLTYDSFNFKRTFEYIKNFKCSSDPSRTLLFVLTNRNIHVYDFIYKTLKLKIPTKPQIFGTFAKPQNSFLLLDNDQIIVNQLNSSRVQIISIRKMIEQHGE